MSKGKRSAGEGIAPFYLGAERKRAHITVIRRDTRWIPSHTFDTRKSRLGTMCLTPFPLILLVNHGRRQGPNSDSANPNGLDGDGPWVPESRATQISHLISRLFIVYGLVRFSVLLRTVRWSRSRSNQNSDGPSDKEFFTNCALFVGSYRLTNRIAHPLALSPVLLLRCP